jgi:hypothetical protein
MSRAIFSLSPWYLPAAKTERVPWAMPVCAASWVQLAPVSRLCSSSHSRCSDVDRCGFGIVHARASSWLLVHDPELALRVGEPVDESGSGLRSAAALERGGRQPRWRTGRSTAGIGAGASSSWSGIIAARSPALISSSSSSSPAHGLPQLALLAGALLGGAGVEEAALLEHRHGGEEPARAVVDVDRRW